MSFLRIHAQPGRTTSWILSWFLFAAGITAYFYVSAERHRDNPDDRVMPTIAQMVQGFRDAALKPAEEEEAQDSAPRGWIARVRSSMLWKDTTATSRRFLNGAQAFDPGNRNDRPMSICSALKVPNGLGGCNGSKQKRTTCMPRCGGVLKPGRSTVACGLV